MIVGSPLVCVDDDGNQGIVTRRTWSVNDS